MPANVSEGTRECSNEVKQRQRQVQNKDLRLRHIIAADDAAGVRPLNLPASALCVALRPLQFLCKRKIKGISA
jgi:hypothetical protein